MVDLDRLVACADRLRQLAARQDEPPASQRMSWNIRAAAGGRTTVRIYGYIGAWEDVTAAEFIAELDAIGDGGIDLHINSGGGSVFDGVAIYTSLQRHPSDVVAWVDSLAASAASLVAMAGDEIVVEKPAKMMIHLAQAITIGNADDHRETGDLLDELDGTIAEIYADRAGGKPADWLAAMSAETWYGSAAAVKAGLADRIAPAAAPVTDRNPARLRDQLLRARARGKSGRTM
jgi:ATP-dependent protease ClpP protease subunit